MQTTITERTLPTVTGIFDSIDAKLFTKYRVELTFVDRVMGGVPQKPDIIESWLRQRIAGGDEEVFSMLRKTLDELGVDVVEGMTPEELQEAAKRVARENNANTFRRDEGGLFLSSYQFKAGAKESVAILYPYQDPSGKGKMGVTKKAARAYFAERIFVDDQRMHLNRQEPDGQYLQIGHVTGPKGPRSTLTYYDYCESQEGNLLTTSATVASTEDCIDKGMWENILTHMQRNGLGAIRSMGHGQFRVTAFDKV